MITRTVPGDRNFRPIHTGPGFNVAQYAADVANELLWALEGLVEEE